MGFESDNNRDELLRRAFLKIRKENQELTEKILHIEKRLQLIEQQKPVDASIFNERKSENNLIKKVEDAKSNLTVSEKEILHIFTVSKNKKYTYGDLASQLSKSNNTIKSQIQSIIKKGIQLSFIQLENNQRAYYLESEMFDLIVKTKN